MLLTVFVCGYILLFWMLVDVITSADKYQVAARRIEGPTKIVDWVLLLTGAHALLNPLIYILREHQVSQKFAINIISIYQSDTICFACAMSLSKGSS